MKRTALLLMAMALLLTLLCPPAQAKGDLRGEVQALLDQAAKALAKKDLDAALALATPEATIRYLDGRTLSVTQWKALAAPELAKRHSHKVTMKLQKASPQGQGAEAIFKEEHQYTLKAEPRAKYARKCLWRVSLIKTAQGWRFSQFRELSTTMTKDGKPHKPAAPAGGS